MLSHARTCLYLKTCITKCFTIKHELDFRYIRHLAVIAIQLASKPSREGTDNLHCLPEVLRLIFLCSMLIGCLIDVVLLAYWICALQWWISSSDLDNEGVDDFVVLTICFSGKQCLQFTLIIICYLFILLLLSFVFRKCGLYTNSEYLCIVLLLFTLTLI